ncbi:MAG TPA: GntR family transcriptional regulator [Limnobacter sp.]|uniref:GntR family transcriptional regulator n=1 Tax=Limnobacter sp. TaxID=2003368 RepID=UPI002ED83BF3
MDDTAWADSAPVPGLGPAYVQIGLRLEQEIVQGLWVAGDSLPNEKRLAERFGVSIGTIRRAIENLESAGLVQKMQGLGTFVRSKPVGDANTKPTPPFHLQEPWASHVLQSDLSTEVTHLEKRLADTDEARALGLKEEAFIWHIEMRHQFKAQLVALETLSLSCRVFPTLSMDLLNRTKGNLYQLAAEVFKTRIGRVTDEVMVKNLDQNMATLFNKSVNEPTLRVYRITRSVDNTPIEKREVWLDPSLAHYRATPGLN